MTRNNNEQTDRQTAYGNRQDIDKYLHGNPKIVWSNQNESNMQQLLELSRGLSETEPIH